ncbi:unnamed protein product [Prorocentrum cordatum]|uniref:Uncharacterized protein n=1 Tax=Prorocentrum cordatum TaxID=2364126 RepID=A0ABN9RC86_9DINO|nr:unnamed protein product [Polarella glacialis]
MKKNDRKRQALLEMFDELDKDDSCMLIKQESSDIQPHMICRSTKSLRAIAASSAGSSSGTASASSRRCSISRHMNSSSRYASCRGSACCRAPFVAGRTGQHWSFPALPRSASRLAPASPAVKHVD